MLDELELELLDPGSELVLVELLLEVLVLVLPANAAGAAINAAANAAMESAFFMSCSLAPKDSGVAWERLAERRLNENQLPAVSALARRVAGRGFSFGGLDGDAERIFHHAQRTLVLRINLDESTSLRARKISQ